MQVTLRPMTDAEYATVVRGSALGYAALIAAGGGVGARAAREQADRELAAVLPAGRETAGHLFLRAVDEEGEPVGHVWLALRGPGAAGRSAWVYDVEVVAARRGHGYGRAIMEQAERTVRSHGLDRIGLSVLGFNTAAISLYRSLGYQVSAMQMTKPLGVPAGPAGADDEPGE